MATYRSVLAFLVTMFVMVTSEFNPDSVTCCQCGTMYPERISKLNPQINPSPFKIMIPKEVKYYYPGSPGVGINVNLTSIEKGKTFRSFMIQARRLNATRNTIEPIGRFETLQPSVPKTTSRCPRQYGSDLTSADYTEKSNVQLEWIPPTDFQGHVEFRATFVIDNATYWVKERSIPVYDKNDPIPPEVHPRYIPPPIRGIDVTLCGSNKGCYRLPEGCREIECEYIVTWQQKGGELEFEMSAITDGYNDRYFALALSEDIYCGKDLVFECVHNSSNGRVQVYQSVNSDSGNVNHRLNDPKAHITFEEGSYNQGRLRCRFRRQLRVSNEELEFFDLKLKTWHLMMAHGMAFKGNIKAHGINIGQLPASSPDKVDLISFDNIYGRARYHLVKAHACLMLLAWIFFAPTGLLWMKYYTTMWPNSRLFGERYWFVAHFNCTFWVVILVVIGVILALVEGGGWSNMPDLPAKAHPILGIIAFICVLCIPIIALIRCPEDHTCRPVGNWFYWLFWTVAFVLAVVNIFIGMDFGKAMVPWWLTWIICLFFLFNMICEIILEVHQCCTHKKNKERRKKWELQKKENPNVHIPEPWPAGRVFKRNVLFTHFIVSLIVVIIAVITVAVV